MVKPIKKGTAATLADGATDMVTATDGQVGVTTQTLQESEEMETFVLTAQMNLYSKDEDGIITCPGHNRMCMEDLIQITEVFEGQNKVIRDHLEKALRKARRKWVREMRKAVRRTERDLRLDKKLTSGFVATKDGLFLVLQHHKPGHSGPLPQHRPHR